MSVDLARYLPCVNCGYRQEGHDNANKCFFSPTEYTRPVLNNGAPGRVTGQQCGEIFEYAANVIERDNIFEATMIFDALRRSCYSFNHAAGQCLECSL